MESNLFLVCMGQSYLLHQDHLKKHNHQLKHPLADHRQYHIQLHKFYDKADFDQNQQPFTESQFIGKWTFVFFGFTHCPDICPTTLALFNSLSDKLQDTDFFADTQFLLVSLDPARDTPEALKTYIQYFNPAFVGVTGDFLPLRKMATQLNVAFQKVVTNHETGDYTIDHGGNVALINPQGHYHGFYKPPLDANKMALTYKSVRMSNR